MAHGLRSEYCVRVTGEVAVRPAGNENPDLPTGDVEVVTTALEVLSESAPLPFQIDDHVEVGEEARLRYRYLDLRRTGPAAALRLRSEVNRAARDVLLDAPVRRDRDADADPVDPRGRARLPGPRAAPARAAGTPCRRARSCSSSCSWSRGLERYFQIARCYRDEDFRADRQPEFTQLDIEMSFVEQDDVIELAEAVVEAAVGRSSATRSRCRCRA